MWIIPARAGFTGRGMTPATRSPDHPRSRGVYGGVSSRAGALSGSSPLARGLQERLRAILPRERIIPARAGFTPLFSPRRTLGADHPRSRGVYSRSTAITGRCSGSSPLARGLRHRRPRQQGLRRIIPARAGFTLEVGVGEGRDEDHPRSRGVYSTGEDRVSITPGSSPLARGLPTPSSGPGLPARIIPARAGFTLDEGSGRSAARDHPRSRGVYSRTTTASICSWGSSPLARGLQPVGTADDVHGGIIPARAGFTTTASSSTVSGADHPRSRGVYPCRMRTEPACHGSSPLARGLQDDEAAFEALEGIIPARAGFTAPAAGAGEGGGDHPRSRGVYVHLESTPTVIRGSSPLARGLRRPHGTRATRPGIIPARAGFTPVGVSPSGWWRDHPRSRGVYVSGSTSGSESCGSSPLARGLRRRLPEPGRVGRIIPARAGFT